MTDTNSIIEGIRARREFIDAQACDKEAKRDAYIEELEAKVEALAPRLGKMFDVAEALTVNGFFLGPLQGMASSPKYCTDGIAHRLGFFCVHPYWDSPGRDLSMTGFFGIQNGGACGEQSLKVNRYGEVIRFDFTSRYCDYKQIYIADLERFINKFDEVEAGLYEYAKNPIPRR